MERRIPTTMSHASSEQEVFAEALRRPADGRPGYLDGACAGDPALRRRVEALLAASECAGTFLDGRPPGLEAAADGAQGAGQPGPAEGVGDRIGRYRLLEQIGEGGCGVVYMAEQEEPVRRFVALKVVRLGMDTRGVIARFEAERQALAMMDHPNIAKVLDAGTTDAGRPYFVMELVRGVKITEYCDANKLSTAERLGLFIQVCHAVQHAHQKGVIHRDIKPSNVLVTMHDTVAVPKVIDFGIAKATAGPLTDKTLFTGFAQLMGTPTYMSPEQAQMSGLDIDTRADIYSLGVLFYELLTGRPPFDRDQLLAAGYDEVCRVIREEDPPKPSTRLSTLARADLSAVAAARHTEAPRLVHLVRGDLDWVVMKCLEKDRTRRYETASELAADLQRHLDGQPVSACPPSAAYRLRKFARRNRVPVAAALALGLAVLFALAGLAVSNRLIAREKAGKDGALASALAEKARADANLARAREAVKEYLLKTSEHPLLQAGDFHDLRKELLETAVPFYEEFVKQDWQDPALELERGLAYDDLGFLRESVGDKEPALADLRKAESIYRRLADRFPGDPRYRLRLAESLNSQGAILKDVGRLDPAEAAFREALALVAVLRSGPAPASEGRDSEARIQGNFGLLLSESGRLPEAETLLRQAVETRESLLAWESASVPGRAQLATSLNNLGTLLTAQRKVTEAEGVFERILEVLPAESGNGSAISAAERSRIDHLRAQAWNNLGMMRSAAGRASAAEEAYRQATAIKRALADRFPSVPQYRQELAASLNNLGTVISSLDRTGEARLAYEEAIRIYERLASESPDDPRYAISLAGTYSNLGRLLGDQGGLETSLPWVTKGIEILEAALRRDARPTKVRESLLVASWTRAMTLCGLERFAEALGDWDRAITLDDGQYGNGLRIRRASNLLNLNHPERATADAAAVAASPTATSDDLYHAAGVFAIAAQIAAEDLPRAEAYAEQAVAALRRALSEGLDDASRLDNDPDLEALRARRDFQELLDEVRDQAATLKGRTPG